MKHAAGRASITAGTAGGSSFQSAWEFCGQTSDSRGSSKLQTSHSLPELPSAATSLAQDGICDVAQGTLQFVSAKISPLSTEKVFNLIALKKTYFLYGKKNPA